MSNHEAKTMGGATRRLGRLRYAAVLVALALYIMGPSLPWAVASNSQSVTSTQTIVGATTAACGSPGVICGGSMVIGDSLVAYPNGSSLLTLTVQDTGYRNRITSVQLFLNDTTNIPVGTAATNLMPGDETTVRFPLTPSLLPVSAGKSYTFEFEAWDGPSQDSGSPFTVLATQQQVAGYADTANPYPMYDIIILAVAVVLTAFAALLQRRRSREPPSVEKAQDAQTLPDSLNGRSHE